MSITFRDGTCAFRDAPHGGVHVFHDEIRAEQHVVPCPWFARGSPEFLKIQEEPVWNDWAEPSRLALLQFKVDS